MREGVTGKEIIMKYFNILLFLVLTFALSGAVYAGPPNIDPDPVNLWYPDVFYDAQDTGTWSSGFEGGSEGRSGAYLQLSTGVVLSDSLSSYEHVISVKAEHIDTGLEFYLVRDASCTQWIGTDVQFWVLFVRPANWMLNGTWKFILTYNDSDGDKHRQIFEKLMGTTTYPIKPSHIQVTESDGSRTISWSAIGNPYVGPFDYRVRIFQEGCGVAQVLGKWSEGSGWYDDSLNRVYFPVDDVYVGNSYLIRLENRINHPGPPEQVSRAVQWISLD